MLWRAQEGSCSSRGKPVLPQVGRRCTGTNNSSAPRRPSRPAPRSLVRADQWHHVCWELALQGTAGLDSVS